MYFSLVLLSSKAIAWSNFLCLLFIQKEIKKEIERRKTGKEMLEYKRRQEEELTKRMLEERNREKAEEKAARERIRQQIAMVNFSFWKTACCFSLTRATSVLKGYIFSSSEMLKDCPF